MAQFQVVFNDLGVYRRRSGVAYYSSLLLRHFGEIGSEFEIVRLSRTIAGTPARVVSRIYRTAQQLRHPRLAGSAAKSPASPGLFARLAAAGFDWGRRAADAGLNAYAASVARLGHWPMYHEPDAIPFSTSVPTVTTVHDLSVLLYPQWHPAHRVAKYERRFERGVRQTALFLTDAASTKDDLVVRLGIAAERIRVVPLAPRPSFRVIPRQEVAAMRSKLGLPERYVLFIGTIEPRKNVEGLLRAYGRLPGRLRHDCPLVLAGGWGWNSAPVQKLLTQVPFATSVLWLGYLNDEDLVAVTNGASVLAYPSFYEGFGLPPLEAMACNVPVVTTHAGSLNEVVGDAAWIVDPNDETQIAGALRELLTDNRLADDFRRRGRNHVAKFSWHETARQTLEAYRQVA